MGARAEQGSCRILPSPSLQSLFTPVLSSCILISTPNGPCWVLLVMYRTNGYRSNGGRPIASQANTLTSNLGSITFFVARVMIIKGNIHYQFVIELCLRPSQFPCDRAAGPWPVILSCVLSWDRPVPQMAHPSLRRSWRISLGRASSSILPSSLRRGICILTESVWFRISRKTCVASIRVWFCSLCSGSVLWGGALRTSTGLTVGPLRSIPVRRPLIVIRLTGSWSEHLSRCAKPT